MSAMINSARLPSRPWAYSYGVRSSLKLTRTDYRSEGFALVISLSLMSFVLMLLLSLSFLVQVELRSAQTNLQQLRAKENARLGLMIALGDLQRYAGPDNSVTARAEVLSDQIAEKNPYWTGVWNTAKPTDPPRWMTSWKQVSIPNDNFNGSFIELVGTGSVANDTDQHVSAPAVQITGKNNESVGDFAWWVSDEGVKASLGTIPLHAREVPSFYDENQTESLQIQLASVHGLEEIISGYDRFTLGNAEKLAKISSLSSGLEVLGSSVLADIDGEAAYHVFTPASYGVLANVLPPPKDGVSDNGSGLMQDLSLFPNLLGDGLEEYLKYGEEYAEQDGSRLFTDIQGLSAYSSLSDGEIATPVFPVLSNMMMAFTIRSHSPVSSNPNFYLRMRFFCEFWNPYTHSLMMQNLNGDSYELELEITGLPEVVVQKTTGSLASSPPIDIQKLLGDPGKSPDTPMVIKLTHDYTLDWLPGQARNWTGVDASRAIGSSPYWSIQNDGKKWNLAAHNLGGSKGLDTGVPRLSADIRHESTGTDELTVRVYLSNLNNPSDRRLLQTVEGLHYEPVSTRGSGYVNTHSGSTFGYHFVMRGPHHSLDHPKYFRGLWLRDMDPRNPQHELNKDWYLNYNKDTGTGSAYIPVADGIRSLTSPGPFPGLINEVDDTIDTDKFQRIMDRSAGISRHYNRLWQDTPLFELPRERVLSLASLQHLYFHNERPFQVGNSWGSDGASNTLEWFDRYYFSGISRSDEAGNPASDLIVPNPTLVSYEKGGLSNEILEWKNSSSDDSAVAREPAKYFMVANRFNINSTSKSAWKAALGSLRIKDFNYLDYPESDTSNLGGLSISKASKERMFTRFSHSLYETYEAPETPLFDNIDPVAPSAFYRHGARRLTEKQVDDLAESIVSRIKEKGEPFFSMQEFLSASDGSENSLLESSIADVLAPTGRQKWFHDWEINGDELALDGSSIDIDHFSPGFLTQADIMTAIGPMLAPRSDTFKIRARANSYNVLGERVATAAIEAIVQRTPQLVDLTANNLGPMDRKFKLLNLRWLSTDEI